MPTPGTAASTATLTGAAAGTFSTGTASSTATLTGLAAGVEGAPGTGTTSATLTASAPGVLSSSATGTLSLSGAAVGVVSLAVSASSSVTLGGAAAGLPSKLTATASTQGTLSGLAVGAVLVPATATSTATLTATAEAGLALPMAYNGLQLFLTPEVRDRPPYLPDTHGPALLLMRHFENRLRGVLVWLRSDGTYCVDTPANYEAAQTQPAAFISDDPIGPDYVPPSPGPADEQFQGLTDSNVNYPWNPYPNTTNSSIPGSYAFNTNWDRTTQDFILDPYLIQWWEGAAENIITQEQALSLTAAGFGDCIGPAPVGAQIGSEPFGQGPYGSWAINA